MRQLDVTVVVLQHECARALQDAGAAAGEARRVTAARYRLATRFDPDQPHAGVFDERIEAAHRIAAAADAGDDRRRQRAGQFEHLWPRLPADDRLELTHYPGIRRRAEH